MIQTNEPTFELSPPISVDLDQNQSEITIFELPVFDVLLKKHIPSNKTQVFSEQFFRLHNTTPLNSTLFLDSNQLGETAQTDIIYDPVSNKLIKSNSNSIERMPVVERNSDYISYKPVIENYIFQRISPTENFISNNTWITLTDLSILIFVAFSIKALGRFLQPILSAMFMFNQSNRLFYERNVIVNRLGSVLNILFFIELGFLLTLVSDYYGVRVMNLPDWQHYFLYTTILIAAFFLKRLLNQIIGYFLNISDIILEYRYQSNLFLKLAALLVFPFITILPFVRNFIIEPVFQLIIIGLLLSYLLRLERLIRVTVNKRFSIFFLFLYLCIVEFGPAFLIIATFLRQ